MSEKEKIFNYIRDNFTCDVTTLCLVDGIYDYLYDHSYSMTIITYNNNRVKIHSFLYDLVEILSNSRIDVTIEEFLNNNLIDMEVM